MLVVAGGCQQLIDGFGKKPEDKVAERVEKILIGARDFGGTNADQLQEAMCLWYADKIYLRDQDDLVRALDGFEDWQKQAGIYPRLETFEIVEVQPEAEGSENYLVLTKINGTFRWMRVPPNAPISWANEEEGAG